MQNIMGNPPCYTSSSLSSSAAAAATLLTSIHTNLDRQRKETRQKSHRSTKLLRASLAIKNVYIPAKSEDSPFFIFTFTAAAKAGNYEEPFGAEDFASTRAAAV